jgi:hypothetical protein
MIGILAISGVALFVLAAVSFVMPIRPLGLTTRGRSAAAGSASVLLFALSAALGLAAAPPPLPASWPTGLTQLSDTLATGFPPLEGQEDIGWSPVVTEKAGAYQAIWFDDGDRENVIRAYVGPGGEIEALAITGALSITDLELIAYADTLTRMADPTLPRADRTALTTSLVNLVRSGPTSTVTVGGVAYRASAGFVHFTLHASPV